MRFRSLLVLLLLAFLTACGGPASVSKGKIPKSSAKLRRAAHVKPDQFQWPVEGPIHSRYGMRHGRPHLGIDIGAKSGTPIVAAADGEVVYVGQLGGYGNLIVLKHEDGYLTAYGHNKKNLVKVGDRIKRGKTIAKVGRTGNASGDHLHFEIRDQDGSYDPMDFLLATRKKPAGDGERAVATRVEAEPSASSTHELPRLQEIPGPTEPSHVPALAQSAEAAPASAENEEDLGESFFLVSDL